jgi:Cu(I)/Ag(I) efflux system membrane protein CusA/SilA
MAGLLPIMWGSGTGSEVMSRIAAPMVGGMISSTVLTLCVIPALYALIKQWQLQREAPSATDADATPATPAAQPTSTADAREGEQTNPRTTP